MGDLESSEGSSGSRSGWRDPQFPQSRLGVGTRWGLSTPAPWKRGYRSTGARDSGIGTGASGMQGTHRMARGDGMVASTPRSGVPNWTRGGQVNRCSPIREGQSWPSPTRTDLVIAPGGWCTEDGYVVG